MARKKPAQEPENRKKTNENVMGLRAEVLEQPITETLETNYMPYAMSVIVSRAIPEIDGFKPSHRKLLYTMYKMGLLTGSRTKSANIVGQTMRLNPHGDAAIYETMVRLAKGCEALHTPFVDSKGNFGKVYSRDMSYAASRYTEAKLSAICSEVFRDIDKRYRGLRGQLRRQHEGAGAAAHGFPERPCFRQHRHSRRHGEPDLRLQSRGGLRDCHKLHTRPGLRHHGHSPGPGFSHGRRDNLWSRASWRRYTARAAEASRSAPAGAMTRRKTS